jgi:hypothetical protein
MANTADTVSIKLIADRLYRNPVMKEVTYEFIIDNALEVMRIIDAPALYGNKREKIKVVNYRASKPANMMRVESIARTDRGAMETMTSTDFVSQDFLESGDYNVLRSSMTYSLNSKYINTNFEGGEIEVIYKYIMTDEECYPLIIDNPILLRCIESYVKWKWFDILNDMDIVSGQKLNKAEQDYMFNVGQAHADMIMPSIDEMESLTNMITQMIPSRTEFQKRFEFLGEQEYLRIQ